MRESNTKVTPCITFHKNLLTQLVTFYGVTQYCNAVLSQTLIVPANTDIYSRHRAMINVLIISFNFFIYVKSQFY